MGCLNSDKNFTHWFGNIHFSGPCNRSCYFCIGQHMMALDPLDNLSSWPLRGIWKFVDECLNHNSHEINLTGSNTDPLLCQKIGKLNALLRTAIPELVLGVRTNGVVALNHLDDWKLFDKASISIPSFDEAIYEEMMGQGVTPRLEEILANSSHMQSVKINIVLGPENLADNDLAKTLDRLSDLGIKRTNLREPYGQPHLGDPLAKSAVEVKRIYGMPVYLWGQMEVTYWDVHYVEVESVNLYANGRVSADYPITRGHDALSGSVLDQSHFPGGRVSPQWQHLRLG